MHWASDKSARARARTARRGEKFLSGATIGMRLDVSKREELATHRAGGFGGHNFDGFARRSTAATMIPVVDGDFGHIEATDLSAAS